MGMVVRWVTYLDMEQVTIATMLVLLSLEIQIVVVVIVITYLTSQYLCGVELHRKDIRKGGNYATRNNNSDN